MELENHTPFPVIAFPSLTPDQVGYHTVVLRQTFTFADGSLALAEGGDPQSGYNVECIKIGSPSCSACSWP
jgi:hypothetical protein